MLLENRLFLASSVMDYHDWGSDAAFKDYCIRFGNRYIWIESVSDPTIEEIELLQSLTYICLDRF